MDCFEGMFREAFPASLRGVGESVLDFPEGKGLSKDVWEKKGGKWILNHVTSEKAKRIVEWAIEKFGLRNPSARIVGSICSNTFNPSSDIDIHISADEITKGSESDFNRKLISAFKKRFVGKPEGFVGEHPFEVYGQHNVNQDVMSVGCYDLYGDKWISGPEILDKDFNPYEEYYDGLLEHLDGLGDEIRNHVLICGEIASVIGKVYGKSRKGDPFMKRMENDLEEATKRARSLFEEVRKKRSVESAPKSEEDARRKRSSKEWKYADSSFKYLDKLGYIATLLSIAKTGEDDSLDVEEKAEKVISDIHSNLFNKDRTGYADVDRD